MAQPHEECQVADEGVLPGMSLALSPSAVPVDTPAIVWLVWLRWATLRSAWCTESTIRTCSAVAQMPCWGPLQLSVATFFQAPPEACRTACQQDRCGGASISVCMLPRMACLMSRTSLAAEEDEEALEDDQPVKKKRKPDKVRSSTPGCMWHSLKFWLAMQ